MLNWQINIVKKRMKSARQIMIADTLTYRGKGASPIPVSLSKS